ncbi:MAG: site-2 protease family protein [Nanoarchaeota archaeon]|nr:site-2 protease family protein [Nanoarchaeota archaeon]
MTLSWTRLALLLIPVLLAIGFGLYQVIPDLYPVSFLLFVVLVFMVLYNDRKKFERQSIMFLRKTTRGRHILIWLGSHGRGFWKLLGMIGVAFGFFFSIWMFIILVQITIQGLLSTTSVPGLSLVLPSPTASPVIAPGVFGVPFWFWIISIALLVIVHEGFHGIFVAREKMRIKSMGIGVLAVLPLAFVEPDEEQLRKGPFWAQQRVYAAGSFANFLLAGLSVFLLVGLLMSAYAVQGVAFGSYGASAVPVSSLATMNGQPITDLAAAITDLDNRTLLEFTTTDGTSYLATVSLLKEQNLANEELVLYDDYGAARAQLVGTITAIDSKPIINLSTLHDALVTAGPNATVAVTTVNGTEEDTTPVYLKPEPVPSFTSTPMIDAELWLEQYIPGTVGFVNGATAFSNAILGTTVATTWQTIQIDKQFWNYAAETFPVLTEEATQNTQKLTILEEEYPRSGYLGIAFVQEDRTVIESLKPAEGLVTFIGGLLAFLFIINFGVGAFNLLPIGGIGLDGYRMWETLLKRVVPKRQKIVMKVVSWITIIFIVLNLALALRGVF